MVDPNGNTPGGVPAEHTWEYAYDNEDRLRSVKAPAPQAGGAPLVTEFRYDAVGNRTVVIDANGQVTTYDYDERDSLKEVHESPDPWTDPTAPPSTVIVTAYEYDHLGNLTRVTRARGDATAERVVDYAYDGLNRLRKETQYPNWPSTTGALVTEFTYDANGNRLTAKDPLGRRTTFGYDALDRLTTITYGDGVTPNVTYTYDAHGNRTSMVDGTGTTTYSYDDLDRLLSVTSPGSKTVAYRYDLDGNRTQVVYPDGTAVTYSFDNASRLASMVDWANRTTSYQYFPDGSLEQTANPNGTTATYRYDHAQRLKEVLNQQSGTVISRHTSMLDAVGNRIQLDELLPQLGTPGSTTPATTTYGYDRLYRLTQVTAPSGTTTYAYDPVGNRTSMTRGTSTSYTYDRADRITSVESVSYTVDATGNLVARGSDRFAYDQANRLTSATVGGSTSTYAYDGDGKRVSKTVGGTTTNFVYDVNRSLPVVLDDGTRKYVWDLGLAYAVETSTGNVEVYHTDGLGSVRAITDATGQVVQTYETDAFGVPTETQGAVEQPFQYTGEPRDGETGFVSLWARMYDPQTGRVLQRDPSASTLLQPFTLNRCVYLLNWPINLIDPTGLAGEKTHRCWIAPMPWTPSP